MLMYYKNISKNILIKKGGYILYILIKTTSEKKFKKTAIRDTDKIAIITCPRCQEKLVLFQL